MSQTQAPRTLNGLLAVLWACFGSARPTVAFQGQRTPAKHLRATVPIGCMSDVDKAHTQRQLSAAQVAGHSIGLLFDAAAWVQELVAYPYGVVVYLRPGQDAALCKTGNGSIATEL